ncbi:MAG: universal stress protein [Cytophagaceae bacterium]|nr:universal stress protein [Cytophagaceae bacterium]
MKNILFPTDFSEHSETALNAAIEIAKKADAKIFVVNAFYVPSLDINASPSMAQQFYTEEKIEIEKELEKICAKISLQKNHSGKYIQTKYLAELNTPAQEVLKAVEEKDIDLIVMGCEPKSSFVDFFISTSWEVIKEAKCSVLVLQEDTPLKPLQNIYFAVENIKQELYSIKELTALAKIFNSQIVVTHINPFATTIDELKEIKDQDNDAITFINAIKEYVSYNNIIYYPVFSDEISEGINQAITKHTCDLLAVVKQNRTWYENLFHTSITKELLTKIKTPLLIVH